MKHNDQNDLRTQTQGRLVPLLPVLSLMLAGGSFWYTWFRCQQILNQGSFAWFDWIRPVLTLLMGALFLLAALLFLLRKESGWSVLVSGLSMVPIILLMNLIILLTTVSYNILQGNGAPFISRLFSNPRSFVVLGVVLFLALLRFFVKKVKDNDVRENQ